MSELAVSTTDLVRSYRADGRMVHALRGVNLQIASQQFVALKGRSGSGKTTLLNLLGGLDSPTVGDIEIFGRLLADMDEDQRTRWRRQELGFIFQSFGLLPTLSAYENVELMLRISKMPRKERPRRAYACLEMVGLGKWADHRPFELSGGQQQRVAIARAIANQPRLILADEATGELDTETTHDVLSLFRRIVAEEGVTILLATHDDLVDAYADRVLRMEDGRITVNS